MNNKDEQLYSVVQSAISISDPGERQEFLNKSCSGKPGLQTRLQAIVDALPEDSLQHASPVRGSEDSVLRSIAPERSSNVVLDDSLVHEAEPIIQPTSVEMPKTIDSSRYQLQGEIARGGMGAVLKGRDTDLGRNLAIKVLLEEHKENPQVIQRFVEEAQIGGQLQHPGIAPVYELGQFEDRRPFFTMKLVKGETLAYQLSGRRTVEQNRSKLLGIFEQVCQTMAYAHSRRVIHRDLKPANIMVGAFGEVQVMDWGLAKVLPASDTENPRTAGPADGKSVIATFRSAGSDAPLPMIGSTGSKASDTQLGSAMGTPSYMPPEQALGDVENMDRRSDVFGLGAILCEILTGQPPYMADDMQALMRLALRGNLDECERHLDDCGADSELVALTKSCLAFEPKDRPKDAGEIAGRLASYLESVETKIKEAEIEKAEQSARSIEEGKRRRVSLALAASIVLFFVLAGSGWMLHQNQVADRQATASRQFEEILNEARLHETLADTENLALRKQELELALQSAEAALNSPLQDLPLATVRSARELATNIRSQLDATDRSIALQERTQRLRERLELIRISHADAGQKPYRPMGAVFDSVSVSDQFSKAFADGGFDIELSDQPTLIKTITSSPAREELVSALDHWIRSIPSITGFEAYEALVSIADWEKAAAQARKNLDAAPDNRNRYLELATVLVLAGKSEEYQQLVRRMCDRFVTSRDPHDSGHVVRVGLLFPNAIELADMPTQVHEQTIEKKLVAEREYPVAYGARALLAYRRGNLEKAGEFIDAALNANVEWDTDLAESALQYLLAVRARVEYDSGEPDRARQTFEQLKAKIVNQELNYYLPEILVHAREVEQHLGVAPSPEIARLIQGKLPVEDIPPAIQREALRRKLIALVEKVDPSAFRKRVRAAILTDSNEEILSLAEQEETNAQPPVILAWLGASLRQAKQIDGAIALLKRAQVLHPSDFWINYELALAYQKSSQANRALDFARTAYSTRPNSIAAQWVLIEALVSSKKIDEAIAPLQRMLAADGFSTADTLNLYGPLQRLGGQQLTKIALENVLAKEPNNTRVLSMLCVLHAIDNEYEEAFRAGRLAVQLAPELPDGYVAVGVVHQVKGEFEQALEQYQLATERKPRHAGFYVAQGEMYRKLGRIDKAIMSFRKVLEFDPKHRGAKQKIASLLADNLGNADVAVTVEVLKLSSVSYRSRLKRLQDELNEDPRDKGALFELATIYFRRGKYAEVLEQAEMLQRNYPEEPVSHAMRGRVFRKQGKLNESIQAFRKAVELASGTPNHAMILYRFGRALQDGANELFQQDPTSAQGIELSDEAIARYQESWEIRSEWSVARRALVHALKDRGLSEQLKQVQTEIASLPEGKLVGQLLAETTFWIREHELPWAHEALDEVLALKPTHPMALALKSEVYSSQRQYRDALEFSLQLTELTPAPQVHLGTAALEVLTGRLDGALERLNGILNDDPTFSGARAMLGATLQEQGKFDEALAQCRQAIQDDPADFQAHLAFATCIADGPNERMSKERLAEAQRHAEIGVRGAEGSNRVANESMALGVLGVVYYRQGEWKKASEALTMAYETAPLQLLYRPEILAMAHWKLGEKDEARKWLTNANEHFEMHDYLLDSQQRVWDEAKSLVQVQH